MALVQGPCKECDQREIWCHSTCERYKDYLYILEIAKAKKYADIQHRSFEVNGILNRKRKYAKR